MAAAPSVPAADPDLLAAAARASRPGKYPPGYFDPVLPVVKKLLDNQFSLPAAVDWLIERGALPSAGRRRHVMALRNRFARFRSRTAQEGETFAWKATLGYAALHLIGRGTKALCGAQAACWLNPGEGVVKCPRCLHHAHQQSVEVAGGLPPAAN